MGTEVKRRRQRRLSRARCMRAVCNRCRCNAKIPCLDYICPAYAFLPKAQRGRGEPDLWWLRPFAEWEELETSLRREAQMNPRPVVVEPGSLDTEGDDDAAESDDDDEDEIIL